MGFAGVYRAVYGYKATNDQELTIQENDILYLIEKADDGWWTVKKRVAGAASEEPEGIVPHNYIEPAKPEANPARALYSYDRQTDEELSFSEGTEFDIYATDGDWILVGVKGGNDFGFVPNNYIEKVASRSTPVASNEAARVSQQNLGGGTAGGSTSQLPIQPHEEMTPPRPQRPQRTGDIVTDANAPPRPTRPSRRPSRSTLDRDLPDEPRSRSDESKNMKWPVIDISGRRRIAKTLVVAPTYVSLINDDGGGKTQKWDVHDIKSYSSEKKHVFLDLVSPEASLELKASSQLEADRIVSSLGQIVGAGRGGGLQEVLAAAKSAGHKQGQIVLDFKAANSRELTVSEFETVFVLNDSDKDWWLVRNISGKEGLVPRKFIYLDKKDGKLSDLFKNKKQKDKQRDRDIEREHEKARTAARELDRERSVSRRSGDRGDRLSRKRSTHGEKSLPDPRKVRLWIDRSGTFKVDAQLLGCSDGKVHLHKANGVKIAVPASKLSLEDIEYVEGVTGVNLSEDKPLTERSGRNRRLSNEEKARAIDETNARNDSWLSFFLSCGVDPQNANRYAKNFTRDNMDESTLSEVNSSVLRTLGLREGDILRVTKKINEKLGRVQNPEGGLYSTQTGALQNNTGTASTNMEKQVWDNNKKASTSATPSPSAMPALQPQLTTAAAAAVAAPPPQSVAPTQSVQPTGALADLLGVSSSASQPSTGISPALTGARTGSASAQTPNMTGAAQMALQAQKTAEAQLASQQRQTQHQILLQQAELQKEQIRLLREQQEQLRRQQEELVQIQRTGSQLQTLGPFATGVAQRSTFAPSASSVLSAPQPPQPRGFQIPQPTNGFIQQPTGPFSHAGLATQPTSTFAPQVTGPFALQRTGTLVQSQPTGPFANAATFQQQPQQQPTGSFPQLQQQQRTGPFIQQQQQRTGPFQIQQQQRTGPFQAQQAPPPVSFGSSSMLPTTPQPNITGQLANLQLGGQPTGPFAQPQPVNQATGQSVPLQTTGVSSFGTAQPTGPFQQGFNTPAPQPTTSFGNQFQFGQQQQPTGPFQQSISQPMTSFGGFSSAPNVTGLSQQPSLYQIQNKSQPNVPFQQPQQLNTGQFSQNSVSQTQVTGPFQLGGQTPSMAPMSSFPQTSFGQPSQATQVPLQSQATGFGFGNQPQPQQQQQQQLRANFQLATASNPFAL